MTWFCPIVDGRGTTETGSDARVSAGMSAGMSAGSGNDVALHERIEFCGAILKMRGDRIAKTVVFVQSICRKGGSGDGGLGG